MEQQIDNLFPTPVGIIDIENPTLCSKYSDIIWNMIDKNHFDEFNHFCTNDNLHTLPEFKKLYELIDALAQNYFYNTLKIDKDSLSMVSMWSNVNGSGKNHLPHVHPNSYYSGVIYLNVPEGKDVDPGNIFFNDPRIANSMQVASHHSDCLYTHRAWFYVPRNGILMFFPSWFEHGIHAPKFKKEDKRISLSFNYILKKSNIKTMSFNLE